jgi:hypothetical protein
MTCIIPPPPHRPTLFDLPQQTIGEKRKANGMKTWSSEPISVLYYIELQYHNMYHEIVKPII